METSVLRFLWRYTRKLKWLYVLLLLNILFGQVLSRSTNWASAQIVEVISRGAPDMPTLHVIGRYLLLIFVCLSLQTVVMLVNRRLDMRFLPYYLGKMSKDLFGRISIQPPFLPKRWPAIFPAKSKPFLIIPRCFIITRSAICCFRSAVF